MSPGCSRAPEASNGGPPCGGRCKSGAVPDVSSHFGSKTRVDSYLIHTEDLAREKMHMRGDVPPLQRSGPVDQGLPASPCGGGDVPASARGGKIRKEEQKRKWSSLDTLGREREGILPHLM